MARLAELHHTQLGITQGVMLGNDAVTQREHTIPPGETKLVSIDLDYIRATSPQSVYTSNGSLFLSTRSRYAQFGVEVQKKYRSHLSAALRQPDTPATTHLPFTNYSRAPVVLEPGNIFKIMKKQGPPLTGPELLDHIDSGAIEIGGDEGTNWWIARDRYNVPLGVGMYVQQPETWIPPSNKPIRIQGETTRTFRDELAKHLKPVRPGDPAAIRISETHMPLYTTEHLIAFLDQHTTAVAPDGVRIANKEQINAPALYGGYPRSPWPIRTELLSTPEERQGHCEFSQKAVIATFYPVLNPAF